MGSTTSIASKKAQDRADALEALREYFKPGDMVYTIMRHCSKSGMMRAISPLAVCEMNSRSGTRMAPYDTSYLVARVIGSRVHDAGGVVVTGAGMDMGYHLVYTMSRFLYPDGFDCIGEHCPSNDHNNREDNAHHRDGGYALRHTWL